MTYYEGGHMMYADQECLEQMTADIEAFYGKLVGTTKPRAITNVPGR